MMGGELGIDIAAGDQHCSRAFGSYFVREGSVPNRRGGLEGQI